MPRVGGKRAVLLIALLIADCGTEPTENPLVFSDTTLLGGGGFDDAGVAGFGGLAIPDDWTYLFGNLALDPDPCFTTQACGVAGVTDQFGNLTAVATDSFGFVTTSNFFEFDVVVVTKSGIATDTIDLPTTGVLRAARLAFDYAYLTARNSPATHNDSAVVQLVVGSDTLRVLKVTTADLQPGEAIPPRAGDCGSHTLGDPLAGTAVTTPYLLCSDWRAGTYDLTDLLGNSIQLQIVVHEVGGDTNEATTLLINNVRVEGAP